MNEKKILVVSGCMAIQTFKGNILEEELYTNVLKERLKINENISLNFDIMTYAALEPCFEKLKEKFDDNEHDMIIFQVRGHYYLDMVNFFSTYRVVERTNKSVTKQKTTKQQSKSFPRKVWLRLKENETLIAKLVVNVLAVCKHRLVNAGGYYFGRFFGAEEFAQIKYQKLISQVFLFAQEKNTPVIFLGVTSRPSWRYKVENNLAKRLDVSAEKFIHLLGGTYVNIFGEYNDQNESKFVNSKTDKISLNNIGHGEVAEKLEKKILKYL